MTNVSNVVSTVGPGATMQEPFTPEWPLRCCIIIPNITFINLYLKPIFTDFRLQGWVGREGWETSESPSNYRTPRLCYGTEIWTTNSTSIDVVFAFLMK